MADQGPTRRSGDERETLLELLRFQRESFVRKVEGMGEEEARWSPVPSGTSLLWLTRHLAYAEVGVTDLVVHWPRAGEPYAADLPTFERIFTP